MNKEVFRKVIKVYHYTTLDSLKKIMDSGMLKFGALSRMNDITEASKDFYLEGNPEDINWDNIKLLDTVFNSIGQISLSQDGLYPGYALHSMWGHYADCGEGCCIVFDKSKIITEANQSGIHHQAVIYDKANDELTLPANNDVNNYISTNYKTLFFHKRNEWEHEQEYRLIKLNCNNAEIHGISIINAIIAVIFHSNCKQSIFDCPKIKKYILNLGNIPVLEYHYSSMWGNKENNMLIDQNGKDWLNNFHSNDFSR